MSTTLKTKWKLQALFGVDGPNDSAIRNYVNAEKRRLDAFAKKYKTQTAYLQSAKKLKEALDAYVALDAHSSKLMFLYLSQHLDNADTTITALINKYQQELVPYYNKIVFFELALGTIPRKQQHTFLKSPTLSEYQYMLAKIFENAQYNLTAKEEELLNLLGAPSGGMWVDGVKKLRSRQEVVHNGKRMPITEAQERYHRLPTGERRKLWKAIREMYRDTVADFAESEINALYTRKKITDELRGFAEPYSATVISYENTEQSIKALVTAVTDAFPVAHRFYRLKKKMSGLKEFQYCDRGIDVGTITKQFDFKTAYHQVHEAFGYFGEEYAAILESMASRGQIDVYPKTSKSGGAFCWGSTNNPTFVLLNHTDDFRSMTTLAHEMGHAIHTELSNTQPLQYQGYTTSVAETASTFFEQVVFDHVIATLPEREQIIALHDKISGTIATVFRQIACFNFEYDLHMRVRERGFVPKGDIAELLNTHMQSYVGKAVTIHEDDGYFFTAWSHIRNHFYVYSYAYGELISAALYARYKQDPTFKAEIKTFLSAGCSMSPDEIFAAIGVDTTDPSFFTDGIKQIESDIARLERLVRER